MNDKGKADQKAPADKGSVHEGRKVQSPSGGLAEKSVTEHHIPGAEGPSGAEAEEDNNP